MRYYELWNMDTGNLIASYQSQAEALDLVQDTVQAHGKTSVSDWGLIWGDDEDDEAGDLIAQGADLADRALASTRAAAKG